MSRGGEERLGPLASYSNGESAPCSGLGTPSGARLPPPDHCALDRPLRLVRLTGSRAVNLPSVPSRGRRSSTLGACYWMTSTFGIAFFSSAIPSAVTSLTPLKETHLKCFSPCKLLRAASVIWERSRTTPTVSVGPADQGVEV